MGIQKVLVIRFSSIGDIVLTTPVVRALAKKGYEVHFLTKKAFKSVVQSNENIAKVWIWEKKELAQLKAEGFHFVVDLHNNLRSRRFQFRLGVKGKAFPKLNIKKMLLVHFKRDKMPKKHIVERYFQAAQPLGVESDGLGLDFFIDPSVENPVSEKKYYAIAVGAAHATKQLPANLIANIVAKAPYLIVLVGGPADVALAREVEMLCGHKVINTVGKTSLAESARILEGALKVISPDTGMMHIAAALNKPIYSFWGNTVPEFGMYPYFPANSESENLSKKFEVKGLSCRPCSKIGYGKCPKGHFKCMMNQDLSSFV